MTDHAAQGRARITVEFLHQGVKQRCNLTVPDADASEPTALLGSVGEILDAFDAANAGRDDVSVLGASSRSHDAIPHTVILAAADGRPMMDTCIASGKAQAALEAAWRRSMADADPLTERQSFLDAIDSIRILAVFEDEALGRHIAHAMNGVNDTFSAIARNLEALNATVALLAPQSAIRQAATAAPAMGDAK